jgi:hypothetical protein
MIVIFVAFIKYKVVRQALLVALFRL